MAVCPKCSYALVLLPNRLRYKCAKCGRLFLQKFIDDREFQRWNKKQREFDRENLKPKRKLLTEEEKKQRKKEYYQKNREKIIEKRKTYAKNNREKTKEYEKQYRQKNTIQVRAKWRKWYNKNKEHLNAIRRKRYTLKKALALQASENKEYKAPKPKILTSVPTYPLAQLLV